MMHVHFVLKKNILYFSQNCKKVLFSASLDFGYVGLVMFLLYLRANVNVIALLLQPIVYTEYVL